MRRVLVLILLMGPIGMMLLGGRSSFGEMFKPREFSRVSHGEDERWAA